MKKKHKNILKVIEWSNEDKCYIGSALPLVGYCCHGNTEESVLRQLNEIIDSWDAASAIETKKKSYSGKFMLRISPEAHRHLAIKANQQNVSLNQYCEKVLSSM